MAGGKIYNYLVRIKAEGTNRIKEAASASGALTSRLREASAATGLYGSRMRNVAASSDNFTGKIRRMAQATAGYIGYLREASAAKSTATSRINSMASAAYQAASGGLQRLRDRISSVRSASNEMGSSLGSSISKMSLFEKFFVGGQLMNLVRSVGAGLLTTAITSQATGTMLEFAVGSETKASQEKNWLAKNSQRLGLDQQDTTVEYAKFAISTKDTKLQNQRHDIFEGIATGMTAMNITGEKANRAWTALNQMIGKGKVAAEELRGQLGEALPGAFQYAAKSMGMTTQELDKFMADGKLMTDDFLPKFARYLKRYFSDAAAKAADNLGQNINRLSNEWYSLRVRALEKMSPAINGVVKGLTATVHWIRENSKWTEPLAVGIGAFTIALGVFTTAVWLANSALAANAVMLLTNPYTAIALAIGAAVAMLWRLYDTNIEVRGAMRGFWEELKEGANGAADYFRDIADGIGSMYAGFMHYIQGVRSLDGSMMDLGKAQMTEGYDFIDDSKKRFEKRLREAYRRGQIIAGLEMPLPGSEGAGADGSGEDPNNPGNKPTSDAQSIVAGGSRILSVQVHLGRVEQKTEIHVEHLDEGLEEIELKFRELLARIINGGIHSVDPSGL